MPRHVMLRAPRVSTQSHELNKRKTASNIEYQAAEEDDDATERELRDDEDQNPNRSQQQLHHLRWHRTNAVPVRRRTPAGRRTAVVMAIGRT
jgi:hypothetical protein